MIDYVSSTLNFLRDNERWLNGITVIFGGCSAYCWFKSATAKVWEGKEPRRLAKLEYAEMPVEQKGKPTWLLNSTAIVQSRWNAKAAAAAAIAVSIQTLELIPKLFGS